jgi:hypothetical protein
MNPAPFKYSENILERLYNLLNGIITGLKKIELAKGAG